MVLAANNLLLALRGYGVGAFPSAVLNEVLNAWLRDGAGHVQLPVH